MRSLRIDPKIPSLVAVAMALLAGLVINTPADPDLWDHVAFGRDIVHERHVPRTDRYSFTSDRAWLNHEWFAEVAMYSAYAAAGNAGLIALKLLLVLSTVGLVITSLYSYRLSFEARAFLATLGVLGIKPFTAPVRPQLFSIFLFTALLFLLTNADRRRRRAPEAASFIRLNQLRGRIVTWFDWGPVRDLAPFTADPGFDGRPARLGVQRRSNGRAFPLVSQRWTRCDEVRRMGADYVWLPKTVRVVRALRSQNWSPVFEGPPSVISSVRNDGSFRQPEPVSQPRCFPGP